MNNTEIKNLKSAYVRFLNAYTDNADFYLNGEKIADNLPFGEFTRFTPMPEGENVLKAEVNSNGETQSAQVTIDITDNEVYTVAMVSIGGVPSLYGILEIDGNAGTGTGNVRVCNLSPDLQMADVYANRYKILGEIDYLEISKYISLVPDTYTFTVKEANKDETILNAGAHQVLANKYNSLYLVGKTTGEPKLRALFTIDAPSYTGEYL